MLSVDRITLHFGARPMLRDVSFHLGVGERVAVVGPNGAGKSTLLRVCAGQLTPESGRVSMPARATTGYLPQDIDVRTERTVFDEVMTVFAEVEKAQDEMRSLEEKMAEVDHGSEEFQRIADRYDELHQMIDRLDAYTAESRAARVLSGLGFSQKELSQKYNEFSGGWRMRAELAKLLLIAPDVLLLDEPTNYLDIETMLWLERHLLELGAAVLFVSHERAFMDRISQRVFEVVNGQFTTYKGNYSTYLELREERREKQQQAYDNQQSRVKQIEDFAARFRAAARRASLVQSRLKELDKMEMVEAPPSDPKVMNLKFPPAPPSNRIMVQLDNVEKKYGNKTVLSHVDLTIERGNKIAVVGLNGAGKSTLIKLISGAEPATDGAVKMGERTQVAYFAQYEYESITPTNTVYTELSTQTVAGQGNIVRDVAGAFLFSGDDVNKPVSVLSGGEKTRLRLAKMLLGSGNLLLLDEPTNHLDISARATLQEALRQYTGAFVLVSHDRTFVDAVVNKIVVVEDGHARQYNGSYADYVEALEKRQNESEGGPELSKAKSSGAKEETTAKSAKNTKKGGKEKASDPIPAVMEKLDPKEARKRLKARRQEAEEIEKTIQKLEAEQGKLDLALAAPDVYKDGAKVASLTKQRSDATGKLEKALERWTELGEEITALEVFE